MAPSLRGWRPVRLEAPSRAAISSRGGDVGYAGMLSGWRSDRRGSRCFDNLEMPLRLSRSGDRSVRRASDVSQRERQSFSAVLAAVRSFTGLASDVSSFSSSGSLRWRASIPAAPMRPVAASSVVFASLPRLSGARLTRIDLRRRPSARSRACRPVVHTPLSVSEPFVSAFDLPSLHPARPTVRRDGLRRPTLMARWQARERPRRLRARHAGRLNVPPRFRKAPSCPP